MLGDDGIEHGLFGMMQMPAFYRAPWGKTIWNSTPLAAPLAVLITAMRTSVSLDSTEIVELSSGPERCPVSV